MSDSPTSPAEGARPIGIASVLLVVSFAAAVTVTAGATKWIPVGSAGIDHIVLPILAFPLVWMVFAMALYGAPKDGKRWVAIGIVTLAHAILVTRGFLT